MRPPTPTPSSPPIATSSIQCQVTATNGGGNAIAINASSSNGSVYVEPSTGADPRIANTTDPGNAPPAGDSLSCSSGSTWANSPSFNYQWLRNGSADRRRHRQHLHGGNPRR